MGSPLYMSPEQLKASRSVDERTDIWAIGVILFELVSGSPPFMADTIAELGAMVLTGQPPRLIDAVPDVPIGLSEIVATCLRKRPEDRFVNLADFADAVARFGNASATESMRTIVRTIGMPIQRATLASHEQSRSLTLRSSDPALAATIDNQAAAQSSGSWGAVRADALSDSQQAGLALASASTGPAISASASAKSKRGTLVAVGVSLGVLGALGATVAFGLRGGNSPPVVGASDHALVPSSGAPLVSASAAPIAASLALSTPEPTTRPPTSVAGADSSVAANLDAPKLKPAASGRASMERAASKPASLTPPPASTSTSSPKPASSSGFATNPKD
jgi:serine/threonine-protein kinase